MHSTQRFIPVDDIKDNLVYLNNGSVCMVIATSAVNFALLFETEQYSIIESFAGMLNSLSFPIQIVIRSKRLDVSSYLATLDKAMERQNNPLLSEITKKYKTYVESLIKENNVLDKKFYVCLTVSMLELGILSKSSENRTKKALTILNPRKDHILRQLARIGLKAQQLNTLELIQLFYDIYNPSYLSSQDQTMPIKLANFDPDTKVNKITQNKDEPENKQEQVNQNQNPIQIQAQIQNENSTIPTVEPNDNNVPSWIKPDDSLSKQSINTPIETVIASPVSQDQNTNAKGLSQKLGNVPLVKNMASPFVVEELIDEVWPKQNE